MQRVADEPPPPGPVVVRCLSCGSEMVVDGEPERTGHVVSWLMRCPACGSTRTSRSRCSDFATPDASSPPPKSWERTKRRAGARAHR